ncbi:hypothetical protein [Kaarinaea lacus]
MGSATINEDFEKCLDALKKAILLAETQPDVTTYSFAGEKYEALMSLVDNMSEDHRESMVDVIDDLLPTEWVFWMDAVEKAELFGELSDAENSTCH